MFGLGIGELIVIMLVAFVAIGPEKLPQLARTLGNGLGKMRKARDELSSAIMDGDPLSLSILDEKPARKKSQAKKVDVPQITSEKDNG